MAEVRKFKLQKRQLKSSLTRFKSFIHSLNTEQLDENQVIQLKLRLDKTRPILNEFMSVQSSLDFASFDENNVDDEDDESDSSELLDFEEIYFEVTSLAEFLIKKFDERCTDESVHLSSNAAQFHPVEQMKSGLIKQSFKLPEIKLPIFNGSFEKWLEFRDSFSSLVHENKGISNVEKFYYLKTLLEGEALDLVAAIQVCDNNYSVAWSTLRDRYENKRLIVHNYIKGLFDAPSLSREDHGELRRLYDCFTKNLHSLKILGLPTDSWDALLIHLMISKFDKITRREWEAVKINDELPTLDELSKFLKNKCELLEKLEVTTEDRNQEKKGFTWKHSQRGKDGKVRSFSATTAGKFACYFCKQNHSIFKCESFKGLDIPARIKQVNYLKLCSNCFDPNHSYQNCKKGGCRVCNKRHNTLIHLSDKESASQSAPSRSGVLTAGDGEVQGKGASQGDEKPLAQRSLAANATSSNYDVAVVNNISGSHVAGSSNEKLTHSLLSTAVIRVYDQGNKVIYARALLDPGSQSNFITESLADQLEVDKYPVNYAIMGVGESLSVSAHCKTNIQIGSRVSDYKKEISCLVIPKISHQLPAFSINDCNLPEFDKSKLADPNFNKSQDVDMLLGVGLFYDLLLMEQKRYPNMPILQNSVLGWIIGGDIKFSDNKNSKTVSCLAVDDNLENALTKFWAVEECSGVRLLTKEEKIVENHFVSNFRRDCNGRFNVRIPFKENVNDLGRSDEIALKRFYALEKRLNKNEELKKDYCEFMREYLSSGHMTKVDSFNKNAESKEGFYLPHHAVIKESSLTTKIRVVFDASAKSDTNISLNDVQYVGPTIQDDLLTIILRSRFYKYVLMADISKMYRQILIEPDERKYQRIFWRENSDQELGCFELNTVTYGTSSAPFLAVRCLQQLAMEKRDTYPEASRVILKDFYMDDLFTASNSLEELKIIQRDVTSILAEGGFQLRKWLSNSENLLSEISVDSNLSSGILHLGEYEQNKTLGIYWNAFIDTIQYSIRQFNDTNVNLTKRTILSIISQIFDPLGLLGPIIVVAKILLQSLWLERLDWDQELPSHLKESWQTFCRDLTSLNNLRIPRHVSSDSMEIELHGFSDSSEKAYGACVYVSCYLNSNTYQTRLLCAKSRVCPVKKICLPRLELCAALLLTKLMKRVRDSVNIQFKRCCFWTDSTIVLSWVKGCPSQWKTFVANRVTQIQELSEPEQWFHVGTKENPADLLSRGTTAELLIDCKLWWEGPCFLSCRNNSEFECLPLVDADIPEKRLMSNVVKHIQISDIDFRRFSSYLKLQQTVCFCFRFIFNSRNKVSKRIGSLTVIERNQANNYIIRTSQRLSFPKEYNALMNGYYVQQTSKLSALNPFLDNENILRVGGRLQKANIEFSKKHPIILDSKHHVTTLIMRQEHVKLMHCGPQQLLYSLREQFWPISGRRLARTIVKQCIICRKAEPITCKYLMGSLPTERVNQFSPFTNVGIDYAGPILIKDRKLRNAKLIKAYICIFICMSTKCVHLELLTDLSSQAFLAMFRRFISRRGKPSNVFSDNGSTFVGANNTLKTFFKSEANSIKSELSRELINWHFIPPRAPNFGGIWESNIKRTKYHLKRILGNTNVTYENFVTVLTQIEGILNSRPLCPISSDPTDPNPLTPAHFLIGRSITSVPEQGCSKEPTNRLTQYQHLQKIVQMFWKRWSSDYISELQTRTKWKQQFEELLRVGSLVIVKEDDLPTFSWRIGRVIKLYPGADNIVRVATIKFADNTVCKRAVSRLCILPVDL